MVLLNTGLCLPEIEIEALIQGRSIVAITQRFILPGKRFILYPSIENFSSTQREKLYKTDFIQEFEGKSSSDKKRLLKAWAKCDSCQNVTDKDKIFALSSKTIWLSDFLEKYLNSQNNLFLAFLQVYKLSDSLEINSSFQDEDATQSGIFIPLSDYLDVDEKYPALVDEEFGLLKEKILNPQAETSKLSQLDNNSDCVEEVILTVEQPTPKENVIESQNWFGKIAEIGNSSDGHTFEKLVRKALLELGFSNSKSDPKISLDPYATGGAGGLDFYCEKPYPVVGECKATKTTTVPTKTTSQLVYLGNKHLGKEHYDESIKLVLAAGELTKDAHQIAIENHICVIRPETLQRLVELKLAYPGSFNLEQIKHWLQAPPFGEATDQYIDQFIRDVWGQLKIRAFLVEAVRETTRIHKQPVSVSDVQGFYNGKFVSDAADSVTPLTNKVETRDILKELSSPLTGYLGCQKDSDGYEVFYFIRSLKIED